MKTLIALIALTLCHTVHASGLLEGTYTKPKAESTRVRVPLFLPGNASSKTTPSEPIAPLHARAADLTGPGPKSLVRVRF